MNHQFIEDAVRQSPKACRETLKAKADILLTMASNVDSSDATVLQRVIHGLISIPASTACVAILLSIQAEALPDACIQKFLVQSKEFFAHAASNKSQLVFAHKEVGTITQKLTHLSQRANQPKAVCRILLQAALISAPHPSCMTPTHALFLQTAISAKMYTLGAEFLRNNEVLEVDPGSTGLTALDYLTFFYYGGMCFVGVRDYAAALDYFTQAIVLPAQAVSAVVVASLKMARLVSLIEYGIAFEIPKYSSSIVLRFSRQDMPVYDAIVKQFVANDAAGLSDAVESHTDVLTQDHTLGLARQVVAALVRHNVRKLTSTYITLSLKDIATAVGLSDAAAAESLLRKMTAAGEIVAKINQSTSMVRFGDDNVGDDSTRGSSGAATSTATSTASSSSSIVASARPCGDRAPATEALLHSLGRHIETSIVVCDRLRTLQQQVLTSPEYISRSNQSSYSRVLGVGGGVGLKGGGRGWGDGDEYE